MINIQNYTIRRNKYSRSLIKAQYCCPALEELDNSIRRPDKALKEIVDDLILIVSEAREFKVKTNFKERIIRFFRSAQKQMLIDFWNKARECYEEFFNVKR